MVVKRVCGITSQVGWDVSQLCLVHNCWASTQPTRLSPVNIHRKYQLDVPTDGSDVHGNHARLMVSRPISTTAQPMNQHDKLLASVHSPSRDTPISIDRSARNGW